MAGPYSNPAPPPKCPFCSNMLDPTRDILYRGIGIAMVIVYCGWCGAVLGGGVSASLHGTKTQRDP